jgi:hypothetical protein
VPFFRFHNHWRLDATPAQVYDALVDVERYPQWWPQVRRARPIDNNSGELICRSALPYSLRLIGHREVEDRGRLQLRATLTGDLVGWSSWHIRADGAASVAEFAQEVRPTGALGAASRIARPILEWNHTVMMRDGEVGLQGYLSH